MQGFTYQAGELYAEEVPVTKLAEQFGTPLYVYSRTHLQTQFRVLEQALAEVEPLICYSVKSNSCGEIIRTLAELGAGVDVVSGGELLRARRAGVPAGRIAFAGVGKTRKEILSALREEILFFTVESEPEMERIASCARELGVQGRVAMRVNPDVDPNTHTFTSTGKKENKFGVDLERARVAIETAMNSEHLQLVGLHMHLGSPLMTVDPYIEAMEKVQPLVEELQQCCDSFEYLDIGGGLGIAYRPDDQPPDPEIFARAVIPYIKKLGMKLVLEPGRFIVGNAGILVSRIEYVKENPLKKFLIADAGMNDLIRPPLYDGYHEIMPVKATDSKVFGDVVGPICESGDFLARDRDLPALQEGDLFAVAGAGAYAFTMASNYNSRGRPAEIMVQGPRAELVRSRETIEQLIQNEKHVQW